MTQDEFEEFGIDQVINLSCNLPGFARNPVEALQAVGETIGETFKNELNDFICDRNIPLDTETVYLCMVEVRFNKKDEKEETKHVQKSPIVTLNSTL